MACFADELYRTVNTNRSDWRTLIIVFAKGLGLPFAASIVAALLLQYVPDDSWEVPKELIFVDVLKLFSIFVLGFHTQAAAEQIQAGGNVKDDATNTYRYIGIYMVCVGVVLAIHAVTLLLIPTSLRDNNKVFSTIYCISHDPFFLYSITIFSFLYMPWFFFGNLKLKKT